MMARRTESGLLGNLHDTHQERNGVAQEADRFQQRGNLGLQAVHSNQNKAQSILLVGGGVAGLAAAVELVRAGRRVVLLEARERLGGRISTVPGSPVPIELGAEFIHGRHEPMWHWIRAAGLAVRRVTDRHQLAEEGVLRPAELWGQLVGVMQRIDPNSPDQSFQDFLDAQKVSAALRQLALGFVEGYEAADPAKIGVRALRSCEWDNGQDASGQQFRLANGYSALIDSLARQLVSPMAEINTGLEVEAVRWQPGRVEVVASQGGQERIFRGRAAVVTLPLGVLKSGAVVFEPALREKAPAIEGLQFGNAVKLVLEFRRAFWPEKDFGFIHAFREAIPTWWSDDRGPVLTGWTGGPKADALTPWTRDTLTDLASGILNRILGVSEGSIRRELVAVHAHDWRADPFSRGAYSYVPVNGIKLPQLLAAPVADTLFFAGEATVSHVEPGTVHGALASGLRAATEVVQSTGDEADRNLTGGNRGHRSRSGV